MRVILGSVAALAMITAASAADLPVKSPAPGSGDGSGVELDRLLRRRQRRL